jgi:hypothetical protein
MGEKRAVGADASPDSFAEIDAAVNRARSAFAIPDSRFPNPGACGVVVRLGGGNREWGMGEERVVGADASPDFFPDSFAEIDAAVNRARSAFAIPDSRFPNPRP